MRFSFAFLKLGVTHSLMNDEMKEGCVEGVRELVVIVFRSCEFEWSCSRFIEDEVIIDVSLST